MAKVEISRGVGEHRKDIHLRTGVGGFVQLPLHPCELPLSFPIPLPFSIQSRQVQLHLGLWLRGLVRSVSTVQTTFDKDIAAGSTARVIIVCWNSSNLPYEAVKEFARYFLLVSRFVRQEKSAHSHRLDVDFG